MCHFVLAVFFMFLTSPLSASEIHIAAFEGNFEKVKALVKAKPSSINEISKE
jgi:multisubunit Na+/H+ antiporter MnhG subunit